MDPVVMSEPVIRLAVAAGMFGLMTAWELAAPRWPRPGSRPGGWGRNLALAALNVLLVRGILPITVFGVAGLSRERGWGLINRFDLPAPAGIVLAILGLDALIYAQHALFHAFPALWRLHRVHHADPTLDVSTGVRFHPGEILVSTLVKMAAVVILGAPPLATLIFEVILNATSQFNHANVRIGPRVEPILRALLVTPDMHRVHHSVLAAEQVSNFGFNFPWWDRLFGTYRPQPRAGHLGMTIGLADLPDAGGLTLGRILLLPFRAAQRPAATRRSQSGQP
jgi:sterol desaturase/sphingolipid hydroxylase (fatty acid hydroxylase superfamily)